MPTDVPERTCRDCDGTGCGAGFAPCPACAGTGRAPPGAVPRPDGIDDRRRLAPTDAQLRTLHRLVVTGDRRDPAVHLASDALGRSDVDRVTVNAHIATLVGRRAQARQAPVVSRRARARRRRVPVGPHGNPVTFHRQTFADDVREILTAILGAVRWLAAR